MPREAHFVHYIIYCFVAYSTSRPIPQDGAIQRPTMPPGGPRQTNSFWKRLRTVRDKLVTSIKEGNYYHPHFGYEPYWVDGEWIIRDPIYDLGPNQTTPKIPLVCGDECIELYTTIGPVCAFQSDNYYTSSCYNYLIFATDECKGLKLRDMTEKYHTFPSYCSFLHAQCSDQRNGRWGLVYRGNCKDRQPQDRYIKNILNSSQIIDRKDMYLAEIEDSLSKVPSTKKLRPPVQMPEY